MSHQWRTKAETLDSLLPRLRSARILPLFHFSVEAWRQNAADVLAAVGRCNWAQDPLIVRSSAMDEDSATESQAGRFLSVTNVSGAAALEQAIERVVGSYGGHNPGHRVLVQPMLKDVTASGVAFSRDQATGASYAVISLTEGADTTLITGGQADNSQTFFVSKCRGSKDPRLAAVVGLIRELEDAVKLDRLDIEFAFQGDGSLWLFQVRPLILGEKAAPPAAEHAELLGRVHSKIALGMKRHPYLRGNRTVYGVMPDWNPAEIIGIRPRPLALSLYRELVTDATWAYQRHNYGYRNLRSFPLMVDLCGLPYIDVRVSFNSFIPADIDADLADRLADHYIDRLTALPALHDKVEFEIILSCYSFDLPTRLGALRTAGFSGEDVAVVEDSLRRLTNRIINREGLWRTDIARVDQIDERRRAVLDSGLDTVSQIYWLLEDCKRYGTLPFAGLARAAFIAIQMLRSLVAIGVLTDAEKADFLAGVETISGTMGRDYREMSRDSFLTKYGHLRPGTYDVLSPRYDQAPNRYFEWPAKGKVAADRAPQPFRLSLAQMRAIDKLLVAHRLDYDVVGLFDFFEAAISGHEYSKFLFTHSLSDALLLLERLGAEHGLSTEDMAHVDIQAVRALFGNSDDIGSALRQSALTGRERYGQARQIALPPLITSADQVWDFALPPTDPNFVTHKSVVAPVCDLERSDDLAGCIVAIPNADPGYDWLFSRGIAGFVTAFGGANSHMAIRASELALPAVIGAGQTLYGHWAKAAVLSIDCANRMVQVVR